MNADSSGIYIGPNKQNRRPKDTIYTTKGLFKSTGEMTIDMPTIHLSESAASRCNLKLKLKAVDPIVKRSQERRIAVVEIISAKCDSIEFPQRTVEKGALRSAENDEDWGRVRRSLVCVHAGTVRFRAGHHVRARVGGAKGL